jgi:hypothetical protein
MGSVWTELLTWKFTVGRCWENFALLLLVAVLGVFIEWSLSKTP